MGRWRQAPIAMDRQQLIELYRRRAKNYNLTANLFYLIGFREWAARKRAVSALKLPRGGTVVEIGCGTGLNFSLLEEAVGPTGKIVGVDLTDAMLEQARKRVEKHRWSNVELVQSDALAFEYPGKVHGVISTFVLSLIPEYDQVIRKGAEALLPGGRWVVADIKIPEGRRGRLAPLLLPLAHPFGSTLDVAERRLWESMERYLGRVAMEELYLGFVYIAWSERTGKGPA